MTRLAYQKPSEHRADWAKRLGISPAAIDLYLASDVIDLHIDSYIWSRILGYDLGKRHGRGALAGRFYSQVDLPRIREAAVTGGIWAITTNPLRPSSNRVETFARNLTGLRDILSSYPDDVQVVRNLTDYRVAKAAGKHAAFIGIQGGNAVDGDLDTIDSLLGTDIIQVTLVHLSTSAVGATSAPLSWIGKTIAGDTPGATAGGLTNLGREYIKRLNAQRILSIWHISVAPGSSTPSPCTTKANRSSSHTPV